MRPFQQLRQELNALDMFLSNSFSIKYNFVGVITNPSDIITGDTGKLTIHQSKNIIELSKFTIKLIKQTTDMSYLSTKKT
jgi:hypothetical protein